MDYYLVIGFSFVLSLFFRIVLNSHIAFPD